MSAAVRELVAHVFGLDPAAVGPQDSPATIAAWDSLQHFSLVLEIEERFGIQLETDEIERLGSVAAIGELLQSRGIDPDGESAHR